MQAKRLRLVKPTLQTHFHIDFEWWKQNDRSWQVYLKSYLSEEDMENLISAGDQPSIDIIDLETAEIHKVDALQHLLITNYAKDDDFIMETTSVAESIFRMLLANGNIPLTTIEIGEKLGRDPKMILQMLSGARVTKGIRPLLQA